MRREPPDRNMNVSGQKKRGGKLELYNEDIARRAVGSLFDEDEVYDEEPNEADYDNNNEADYDNEADYTDYGEDDYDEPDGKDYVVGYDKPEPAKPKSKVKVHTREELPPEDDELGYEEEDEEPPAHTYRRRERPKEPTPAPKPAVKVNVATTSSVPRGTRSPNNRARPVHSHSTDEYEDEMDTFRQRYKKRESDSRAPQAPRRTPATGRSAERVEYGSDYDDTYSSSPVRWVAAALTFIFLIILAFLVFRISVMSGELKTAKETLENAPSHEADITAMRLTIEKQEEQLIAKDDEIERLNELLAVYAPNYDPSAVDEQHSDTTEPDSRTTTATPETNTSQTGPTTYKVVSGDNLSKISQHFYGNASQANIDKLKTANSMTSDALSVGQELKIP